MNGRAGRKEVVEDAREELLQDLGTSSKQIVDVTTLRNTAPISGACRQGIPVHHADAVIEICQYPRRQQTAHAGPQHNRMVRNPLRLACMVEPAHPKSLQRP